MPSTYCTLAYELNLQQPSVGAAFSDQTLAQIDLSVITISNLTQNFVDFDTCWFSALLLNGTLSNGLLVVNATIDLSGPLSSRCSSLWVSLIDGSSGSLNNITIVGEIRIKNLNSNIQTLILSKAMGNVGTVQITNVTSNLNFFQVTGSGANYQELQLSNATQQISVTVVNTFDSLKQNGALYEALIG